MDINKNAFFSTSALSDFGGDASSSCSTSEWPICRSWWSAESTFWPRSPMDTSACYKSIQHGHCGAGHHPLAPPTVVLQQDLLQWDSDFGSFPDCEPLRIFPEDAMSFSDLQDLERQAFDLRSSMQPDLVFLEVVMRGHSCCALHLDAPTLVWQTSFIQLWSEVKRVSVQPGCIGKLLGFESFPSNFNSVYLFSFCCSDNFRMCQSACERGGWPCLTSELSWKPVACDWLLVDSGASFSAISNEAASHYRGTSPFPAHPENFLVQMQAVFLWSGSQLFKL